MQDQRNVFERALNRGRFGMLAMCTALLALATGAAASPLDVTVISPNIEGSPITTGYRWVLQQDVTYEAMRGTALEDTLATNMSKSYIPVVSTGHCPDAGPCTIDLPDPAERYFLSVLPDQPDGVDCQQLDQCYTMSGKQIAAGQTSVLVVVTPQPLPTAQIYLFAHADVAPVNAAFDVIESEVGLGGFDVIIKDFSGGVLSTDNYGNPLGTLYELGPDGATPVVTRLGDGTIHTMTQEEVNDPLRNPYNLKVGEALVDNLAPGKYGVHVTPPQGMGWQQTSTIEGTKTIDAWIKAGEPRYAQEFAIRGGGGYHATFGFVRPDSFPPLASVAAPNGRGSISGINRNLRLSRPPNYSFSNAEPLANCWVALNDRATLQGMYAAPCNPDSTFLIEDVPAGDYQVIIFDRYLDLIFNTQAVTVADGVESVVGGPDGIGTFRWFGSQEHWSFYDANQDGMWDRSDPNEYPLDEQAVNLRFRDGSIYQATATDLDGFVPFEELFPFFHWLVAEIDFARFKATGVTITVDNGGQVLEDAEFGEGKRNPQLQDPDNGGTNCGLANGTGDVGCLTRTETGPALLEGYNLVIGSNSKFEWGKTQWGPNENGGISGIVYYATTRAENDPRFAAAEPWEPGIPRVQINLYRSDSAGNIQDTNGLPGIQLADIDNHPLGWSDGGAKGDEDVDHNLNGVFDMGDAIEFAHTDSWDDSIPTDCPADSHNYDPADPFNLPPSGEASTQFNGRCYDALRNFNQVRPAVFDGGFGLGPPWTGMTDVDNAPTGNFPGPEDVDHNGNSMFDVVDYLESGYYVVESATPPGYMTVREQDKNVDFGDTFTINPLALPPVCVGDPNPIAAGEQLALFPGVDAPFQNTVRPLCDRKLVQVSQGKNAAVEFFLHTEVPVAGHWTGFTLNDLANEFNVISPNFGEKFAPAFLSAIVRDYAGNEVYRTTTDGYGVYNVLVPSSFRINTPMASGVSANVLQLCLNSAIMENPDYDPSQPPHPIDNPYRIANPDFNKNYSQFCYSFNAHAALTTYLDTPIIPISAFTGPNNWQLDCEYPDLTPVIHSVSVEGNGVGGGPYATDTARQITITSVGIVDVLDPNAARIAGENTTLIPRNFGFGTDLGTVTINGVPLTIDTWSDLVILATIPAGVETGQLEIVRGDNGVSTVNATTVIVDDGSIPLVTQVPLDGSMTIQDAIDLTPEGGVVLVPPGNYNESLIVTKPIQLQGWGAPATIIEAALSPIEKIIAWREKVNYLTNCTNEIELLRAEVGPGGVTLGENQFNNTPDAASPCGFRPGTGLFLGEEAPGVLVATRNGVFDGNSPARIDGFTITGAVNSHGVLVNGFADFLEVSNNLIANNQGKVGAGGIRVGYLSEVATERLDSDIDFMNIHHNHITQNGMTFGFGGGIGIYRGADNYRVTNNYICGNFAQGDGGGIAHYGRSDNGLIADNKIVLNQAFSQFPGEAANGGGILVSGHGPLVLTEVGGAVDPNAFTLSFGSGNVKILRNHIQGNNVGSGDGAGIALNLINGEDVVASSNQDTWYHIDILDNIIVNNVAGTAGGGISLKDALKVSIVNNTVMNNDSTATSFAAFGTCTPSLPYPNESCPQPAGIVSYAHSTSLIEAGGATVGTFSNPAMINNIVVGNRSQYWLVSPGPDGFDIGELIDVPGPSDFAVLPAGAGTLTTLNSVFSTGNDAGGHVLGGLVGSPGLATGAYAQSGGILSLEAEHFASNTGASGVGPWGVLDPSAGASGGIAVKSAGGAQTYTAGTGPLMTYDVSLDAGVQRIWIRYRAFNFQSDSVFVQLDDGPILNLAVTDRTGAWAWMDGASTALTVPTTGIHTLKFYRREMDIEIDKVVLTPDIAYNPATVNGGLGPVESAQLVIDATNLEIDADLVTQGELVINPYKNGPPGFGSIQPDGSFIPFGEFPAVAAAALDEGGNFIDVHYGPLSPVGNYHLQTADPNIAIDAGAAPTAYPDRVLDIDRDARPQGATVETAAFDIGADEVPGAAIGTGANAAPLITFPMDGIGANNISAYTGVSFTLRVMAVDANGDVLTYSLCRDIGVGCSPANVPAGMSINATTGIISWPAPPAPAGGSSQDFDGFQVTASDGALADTNTFRITLRSADLPVANPDSYAYNSPGQLVAGIDLAIIDPVTMDTVITELAPGMLVNDGIPNEANYGVVRASKEIDPALGTLTSLTPQGGFVYIPPDNNFIGTDTFVYRASNNVGFDTAVVTVMRNLFTKDARYVTATGHFVITGFGRIGATVTVELNPPLGDPTPPCLIGTTAPIGAGTPGNGLPEGGPWTLDVAAAATACAAPATPTGYSVSVTDSLGNQAVQRMGDAIPEDLTIPLFVGAAYSEAPLSTAFVQCPGDTDGDAIIDDPSAVAGRQVVCKHLGAGDGFARMADGRELYGFSFNDLTGVPLNLAIDKGILNAQFPAPTLEFNQNDEVYLTLTNVNMLMRPDLFDPHTVHFHGFPNASSVFDGVPESSIAINGGFSLTYYYNVVEPGTFMYHCHVEAAEHMQMGMLGNLYVHPAQNGTSIGGFDKFVYNDGDGSTGYDIEVPIQIGSFDSDFHDASFAVQPLPFAEMHDDYQLLNGRGYPDTTLAGPLPVVPGGEKESAGVTSSTESSQVVSTVVEATVGQKILLRISNLNVTQYYTLATTGLKMQVVGTGAHILRGPGNTAADNLYYETNSVSLGGGQSYDILIDTTDVAPGTYLLYSTNLNELSNGTQDFGGMMTEIVISAP